MKISQFTEMSSAVTPMVSRVRRSASSRAVASKRPRPSSRATRKARDQTTRWASTSNGLTCATALKYTAKNPHHR